MEPSEINRFEISNQKGIPNEKSADFNGLQLIPEGSEKKKYFAKYIQLVFHDNNLASSEKFQRAGVSTT